MKVSTVISTYNGSQFILEQLESIRLQTRSVDEVLIYDDCSTDDTVTKVENYIQQHNLQFKWKIVRNETNVGWRKNFMNLLWDSTGDIVFTADQDDIWRNDKVEIMTKIMEEHSEIDVLVSNVREFYEDGHEKIGTWKNTKELFQVPLRNNFLLCQAPGCTYCSRRNIIEKTKEYWKPSYEHDAILWRIAVMSNSLYAYSDDLIRWRKHKESTFAKESRDLKCISEKEKWIFSAKNCCDDLQKYLTKFNGEKKNQQKVLSKNIDWLAVRTKFYQTKNPLRGLQLAFYWDCFPRYRQYLGDWYLLFIKRK